LLADHTKGKKELRIKNKRQCNLLLKNQPKLLVKGGEKLFFKASHSFISSFKRALLIISLTNKSLIRRQSLFRTILKT
jgi:hypothetical protein